MENCFNPLPMSTTQARTKFSLLKFLRIPQTLVLDQPQEFCLLSLDGLVPQISEFKFPLMAGNS